MSKEEQRGAVYYIDTGKQLPNFLAGKPTHSDKEQFFKGDWKRAWPQNFTVDKGEES